VARTIKSSAKQIRVSTRPIRWSIIGATEQQESEDEGPPNPVGVEKSMSEWFEATPLDYVQYLRSTKIVVVAGRDEWEDDFRLLEALASGALVFSDVPRAAPMGFENGTNIVFYDSASSLVRLLGYYLQPINDKHRYSIARKGYELARRQHLPSQRLESLVFGSPLTMMTEL
jgi:Glycosyl transferases group 1